MGIISILKRASNRLTRISALVLLLLTTACLEVEGSPSDATQNNSTVTLPAASTAEVTPTGRPPTPTQVDEEELLATRTPDSPALAITDTPASSEGPDSETVFTRMEEILEDEGASVEIREQVEQDYIRAAARILEVDGEKVLVFVFPNERGARVATKDISEDGRTIGGQEVNFRTPPRYYMKDQFILLTVSQDEALLDRFAQALGEPFAGGEPALKRPEVIETGEDVYHALLYEGAEVEVGKNLKAPIETEEAFYLLVEGEEIQIFQMETREEAEQVAEAISEDGSTIGLFPVPATDTPHFFLEGRVIVFYQGDTREVLNLLVELLGEPITENI